MLRAARLCRAVTPSATTACATTTTMARTTTMVVAAPMAGVRAFATGARQGSSIQNVRMVKHGKFEIPARLLKRWLAKRAKGGRSSLGNAEPEKAEREYFSAPYEQLQSATLDEMIATMERQWLVNGGMRGSWLVLLCDSVRTSDELARACDVWLLFQSRLLRFACTRQATRALVEAARRTNALDTVFLDELRRGELLLEVPYSLMADLIWWMPRAAVPELYQLCLHRVGPKQPVPRKLLTATFRRCWTPDLTELGERALETYVAQDMPALSPKYWTNVQLKVQAGKGDFEKMDEILKASSLSKKDVAHVYLLAHLLQNDVSSAVNVYNELDQEAQQVALRAVCYDVRRYEPAAPSLLEFAEQTNTVAFVNDLIDTAEETDAATEEAQADGEQADGEQAPDSSAAEQK